MRVVIHSQATRDVIAAAAWYEQQSEGLGRDFVAAVDESLANVMRRPATWPLWPKVKGAEIRRYLLKRFPYAIGYEIRPSEIFVIVVAHSKRRPQFWRRRSSG